MSVRLGSLLLFALLAPASAHEARPLVVTAQERPESGVELVWRAPGSVEASNAPEVTLAGSCRLAEGQPAPGGRLSGAALYICPPDLEGAVLNVRYPLFNPSVSTLVRMERARGEVSTGVLAPDVTEWAAPPPSTFRSVSADYFRLGVKHILIGIDHILFLIGLLLIARTPLRTAATVTGFTLSHSLTLALVALGILRISIPAIEALIALSIVFVAAEIVRNERTTLAWRHPILVAAIFGLLHGAGFAAALGETGLPQVERAAALLFFNLGVEAGQLMIVAGAFGLAAVAAALASVLPKTAAAMPKATAVRAAGGALGVLASYWFFERAASVFA